MPKDYYANMVNNVGSAYTSKAQFPMFCSYSLSPLPPQYLFFLFLSFCVPSNCNLGTYSHVYILFIYFFYWRVLEGSGEFGEEVESPGRQWGVWGGNGEFGKAMGSLGRQWRVLESSWEFGKAMGGLASQ